MVIMRIAVASFAVGSVAIGLWYAVSPGEDRKKEILKNLPEANPVRMDETRKRNALMLQILKEAAETNDNIARGFGSQK